MTRGYDKDEDVIREDISDIARLAKRYERHTFWKPELVGGASLFDEVDDDDE